jgi:hypothetical protein
LGLLGWGTDVSINVNLHGIGFGWDGFAGAGIGVGGAAGLEGGISPGNPDDPSPGGYTKGVAGFVAEGLSAGISASEPLTGHGAPSLSGSLAYKGKGFFGLGMGAGVMANVGYSRSVGWSWKYIGHLIVGAVRRVSIRTFGPAGCGPRWLPSI